VSRPALLVAVLAVVMAAGPAAARAQMAIPEGQTDAPRFIGAPAAQQPVVVPLLAPQHPFLAPNGRSNIHNDPYMSGSYETPGPLGRETSRTSVFEQRDCASLTFDSRNRIVTICVGIDRPVLVLKDPVTLRTLASLNLPPRQPSPNPNIFGDFTGGGYFYLDERDRAVIPTTDRHLYVVEQTPGPDFRIARDVNLNGVLASDDKIVSVLPDWAGRLWFVTQAGIVGTVDRSADVIRVFDTSETISNSFSVDETGGVFIVTDGALYRFDAGPGGAPVVTWRQPYPNSGQQKPGQASSGSGTTPDLIAGGLVAIADNADPMNVVVYRREASVSGPREICRHPVFEAGASATDNSLITAGSSIVVENNHGYTGPAATQGGRSTAPGIERIDFDVAARRCTRVWRSDERAPTVVPKLSLPNGLVYAYTKDPQPPGGDDLWYLAALDFRTGRTVYKVLAGEGLGFNNNYAPISLGPDGSAYVGVLGGLVRLADATPPPNPRGGRRPSSRGGSRPCLAPRLFVRARSIGDVQLGRTRRALSGLGGRAGRRSVRFCVIGGGSVRVALKGRRRQAGFVLSTAPGHRPGRIGPGSSRRALRRRYPRLRRVTGTVYRSGPRGRLRFGVRGRRVRWVAVGPLRMGPRATRRALVAVGVRAGRRR
jgi:hypothetical protein